MSEIVDLNAEFGKALLRQFFEPMLVGRQPDGSGVYAPSGVSLMAQELFRNHSRQLMDEVWKQLDMEVLAAKMADLVVAELTRVPGRWDARNVHQEDLTKRVREIVAQQLGQRVVDQMDLRLGPRELSDITGDPA